METAHLSHPAQQLARPAVVVAPDSTLRAAAAALWEADAGVAVVGTTDDPTGVLSERDILMALAEDADPDTVTAAEVMTPRVIAAKPEDRLVDVAYLMFDDAIRHVPVVDDDGYVTGIVSVRDLLRPLLCDALGHPAPA
jgi:CBS domain-containing protein